MSSELWTALLLEPPIGWKVLVLGLRNIKLKDGYLVIFYNCQKKLRR